MPQNIDNNKNHSMSITDEQVQNNKADTSVFIIESRTTAVGL